MTIRSLTFGVAVAAMVVGATQSVSAAVFDWSYAGNNGGPVSASGTLDATPDAVASTALRPSQASETASRLQDRRFLRARTTSFTRRFRT
jgi:hypothetical protein